MVERLLILKNNTFDEESDRTSQNQSFDINDDDMLPEDLQNSENNSDASKVDIIGSTNRLKPSLLAMQSPSTDTLNDQEDSLAGDTPTEKVKKKKVRRSTEHEGSGEPRKHSVKVRPWYTKIDFTKPLMFIGLILFVYLTWTQRDIWIPRLLTSNTRIRHLSATKVHQVNEKAESPSSSSKDSGSISGNQEDNIDDGDDDDDDDDDDGNNDQGSIGDDDDDSPAATSKGAHQKLSFRIRRNKMSFSKDRPKKKHRRIQNQIVDGDDDDDDDDDDDANIDDDDDDDDDVKDDIEDEDPKLIKSTKESVITPTVHSSKIYHHHHNHRPVVSREQSRKISLSSKSSGAVLAIHDDIVEQLRKVVKSRGRHKDLAATLIKETGLNKKKINRFINQNDLSIITLEKLIAFLHSFNSTILIVDK